MKTSREIIKIRPTCEYPCQWDDLIDSRKKVIATIYTPQEGKKDNLKPGIAKGKDGIYDIVVHAKDINNEVVRHALRDLEKVTGKRYRFVCSPSPEDRIIAYAGKLKKPLKGYGSLDEGYDFSKAKTAKQKTEIIGAWIGEILSEALTYKDVEVVRSLIETIMTEVKELLCEKA